ncbi:hypothetical protein [Kitasatospora sp. NPDC096204]|uniref:hypothetical protein n=1 Tax=Kitasatospora sp. NPDC096204 TaxID=3364094 RepID=UPI0037F962CE
MPPTPGSTPPGSTSPVWPARGERSTDGALLGRALAAWSRPGARTHAEPGTDPAPPTAPVHLLFAGTVDGTGVAVFHDGGRIARCTDGRDGQDAGLDLARADDADLTTSGAVVLHRQGATVRYLLAPWVDSAETRRIDQPDTPARPLDHPDGLTAPTPAGGPADCRGATLLELHSSPVVADRHAFLLTDLGGLIPTHLTYAPPPDRTPADHTQADHTQADHTQADLEPREATAQDALRAWARAGCAAPDGTPGVRRLDLWSFAVQPLPQNAGSTSWVCLRADRWDGAGSAATAVVLPGSGRPQRSDGGSGRTCSRFDRDTVSWAWWRSPRGSEFLLAAGSRRVTRLAVKGPNWSADRSTPDRTLAVERPARAAVQVEALLDDGTRISPPPEARPQPVHPRGPVRPGGPVRTRDPVPVQSVANGRRADSPS